MIILCFHLWHLRNDEMGGLPVLHPMERHMFTLQVWVSDRKKELLGTLYKEHTSSKDLIPLSSQTSIRILIPLPDQWGNLKGASPVVWSQLLKRGLCVCLFSEIWHCFSTAHHVDSENDMIGPSCLSAFLRRVEKKWGPVACVGEPSFPQSVSGETNVDGSNQMDIGHV